MSKKSKGKSKLPTAVRIAIHAMDEDPNLFAALYRPSERAEKRAVKVGTKKRVIKGVSLASKTKAASATRKKGRA